MNNLQNKPLQLCKIHILADFICFVYFLYHKSITKFCFYLSVSHSLQISSNQNSLVSLNAARVPPFFIFSLFFYLLLIEFLTSYMIFQNINSYPLYSEFRFVYIVYYFIILFVISCYFIFYGTIGNLLLSVGGFWILFTSNLCCFLSKLGSLFIQQFF